MAIRLLDRGAADRVLVAPDWRERLDQLTQGLAMTEDLLLLFLPEGVPEQEESLRGFARHAAEIRGRSAELAAALDFPGERAPAEVWPKTRVRVIDGEPRMLGGPLTWRDESTGLIWVRVCGGTFFMGSPDEEIKYIDEYAEQWASIRNQKKEEVKGEVGKLIADERPRHAVLVEDFWITRNELTLAQVPDDPGKEPGGSGALPRTEIDWEQSRLVCKRLPVPDDPGGKWKKPDLSSEAQWEYAARAGSATRWSFGDDPGQLGDFAWFEGNAGGEVQPVGKKRPNGLCLADMHGNVWEWTQDCFREDVYASRIGPPVLDPLLDPKDCKNRVVRGGSFAGPPFFLRSAARGFGTPDDRLDLLGLRCVRSRVRQLDPLTP